MAITHCMGNLICLLQLFPNSELGGCFFHLTKNFKKAAARHGLLQQYNNNADFALESRRIPALAFVPHASIDEAFDQLQQDSAPELQPVLDWFEDNYLGRPNRRGDRRPPTFPRRVRTYYNVPK